jgi:hypothetical protein
MREPEPMKAPTSHVLAADHRVHDFEAWWPRVESGRLHLAGLATRPLLVYRALTDPNRVFVTMGIPARESLDALLRSGVVLEWFDAAGVDDVPPVFIGQDGVKLELIEPADAIEQRPGVVVAAVAPVPDPEALTSLLDRERCELRSWGVRRLWVYRALDDEHELLIVHELDSERQADQWIEHPQPLSDWLARAGAGVYPPVFVGILDRTVEPERPQ